MKVLAIFALMIVASSVSSFSVQPQTEDLEISEKRLRLSSCPRNGKRETLLSESGDYTIFSNIFLWNGAKCTNVIKTAVKSTLNYRCYLHMTEGASFTLKARSGDEEIDCDSALCIKRVDKDIKDKTVTAIYQAGKGWGGGFKCVVRYL